MESAQGRLIARFYCKNKSPAAMLNSTATAVSLAVQIPVPARVPFQLLHKNWIFGRRFAVFSKADSLLRLTEQQMDGCTKSWLPAHRTFVSCKRQRLIKKTGGAAAADSEFLVA